MLSLVGVTRDAPDGTKPMLNPFKLLSTPVSDVVQGDDYYSCFLFKFRLDSDVV